VAIPTKDWKGLGSYGTIGLEVVLCMLAGLFGGRWLDARFHTEPYLAVVGFLFGVAAGGNAIRRAWKEMQEVARREEAEEGNPAPIVDAEEELDEGAEKDQEPKKRPRRRKKGNDNGQTQ